MGILEDEVYNLASIFRSAIISAKDEGYFSRDYSFNHFPRGCCGDTCYLLATFLKSYDIQTIYVWGDYGMQSHAWLVVNDERVKLPKTRQINMGTECEALLRLYGNESGYPKEITNYQARDLSNGLVVDITADQFGEPPVYVGKRNAFYQKYLFRGAHICDGVSDYRLNEAYRKIMQFLP